MNTKKGIKIQCSNCGTEVWETLLKCPECGTLTKRGKTVQFGRIAIIPIIFLAVFFTYLAFFSNTGDLSRVPVQRTGVTLEQFNDVETGMSYSKVCNIFGSEGELLSEVDLGEPGFKTEMYSWVGYGNLGANCNVTFQEDRVISKAQFGLQ